MTALDFDTSLAEFVRRWEGSSKRLRLAPDLHPCLDDATAETGFDRHYVYHPAWAARVLRETRPTRHVDIGSTLHFCATVSAFVDVEFYDYRPAALQLDGLTCGAADLLALPFDSRSLESVSCMHTIEHIGLGRYGDAIDPDGDLKALAELERVVAPGGSLLVVVPVGEPRIVFNAHRVYAFEDIPRALQELVLVEFALIPEHAADGPLLRQASPSLVAGERYGCGCYWFRRPAGAGVEVRARSPQVTVVVTAYDYGEFVSEAVTSALDQSYPELEVVAVDDGSTDATYEVLRTIAERRRHPPVRILRQENSGHPALARNAGVRASSGEYVLCLDADDKLAPGFVAACVEALERQPGAGFAYGPQLNFGTELELHPHPEFGLLALARCNIVGSASLFRRSAWEAAGGYDASVGYEDWDFWLACAERGHAGVRVADALWYHRDHGAGVFAADAAADGHTKAAVVLNHPRLYGAEQLDWAQRRLADEPDAVAADGVLYAIPQRGERVDGVARTSVFTGIAFSAELEDDPLLLRAWLDAVGSDERATLVVAGAVAADGDASAAFLRLASAEGVADGRADVLALPAPSAAETARIASKVDVVVSRREPPRALRTLPRADAGEALRALAARHAAGAPLPPRVVPLHVA